MTTDRPPVIDPAEWAQVEEALRKQPKYRNQAFVDGDGQRWHSQQEFVRWGELTMLAWAGKITDLRRQVRYVLQPAFVDRSGHRQRAITYTVDFEYREGDQLVAEDWKGAQTQAGLLRQKLFRPKYPDVELRITGKGSGR